MAKKKSVNMLTTVTPFSKVLAMFLFVLFPILGFYLGMKYQQIYDLPPQVTIQPITQTPTPQPSNASMTACTQDADCILTPETNVTTNNMMSLCCGINSCQAADQWTAINTRWLNQRKTNVCGNGIRSCPMIRYYCPTPIQDNYQAKCISSVCQKVAK